MQSVLRSKPRTVVQLLTAFTLLVAATAFNGGVAVPTASAQLTGELKICKVAGPGVTAGTNFTFSAGGSPVIVAAGSCTIAGLFTQGTNVTVQETVPSGMQVSAITVADSAGLVSANLATGTATVSIGGFHNTVIFTNAVVPSAICTVTKGYYRNHPAVTASRIAGLGGTLTVGGRALTTAQVQAILDATPGDPGNVTFSSNSLLNLTQQLITALLNLRGNVLLAPATVRTAILSAQAGIQITIGAGGQIQIGTTLTQAQISTLTDVLSAFNEGQFAGFLHCPD